LEKKKTPSLPSHQSIQKEKTQPTLFIHLQNPKNVSPKHLLASIQVEIVIVLDCPPILSQPHFGLSVRMRLTLPKVGIGSLPGLPQFQSSTAEGKIPCLEVFFILLERS